MAGQSALELGVECLKTGKIDEAVGYLEKAAAQFPTDYRGFSFLGVAYARKGLNNRAIGTLQVALKIEPNIPGVHFNLGLVYMTDGFTDRAREHFERALELDPNYTKATQALNSMIGQQDLVLSQACARHTDEPAVGLCSVCRLAMCEKCRTMVSGQPVCAKCAGK